MPSRFRRVPGPKGRTLILPAVLVILLAATLAVVWTGHAPVADASSARTGTSHLTSGLPPIKHVWVIVEENESASTTFGAGSPAPYLSKTLVSEGAYLPNYYGVGHNSLDNYIAMVSGQAPNQDTSADCTNYVNFPGDSMDSNGQENSGQGCIYPTDVPTLMSQMDAAGLTWRAYEDDMPTACDHPAVGAAETNNGEGAVKYATRHNPFVYFHYVIDNTSECDADDVPATQLTSDLSSVATTPNYSFITPDVCDDGHDATGTNCTQGGLAQSDAYLQQVVPEIQASPAYQQNGLIMIVFDEAATSDSTACCGEIPGPEEAEPGLAGAGGGDTGAVLLSPFIAPNTVSSTPYNHYTMLGSVENIFGLSHIGYAALSGETYFGSDIFTQPNGPSTTTTTSSTPTPTTTTATTPVTTTTTKTVTPSDSAASLSPRSFLPTGIGTARQHHGTTIIYTASAASTTILTVQRSVAGYRIGAGACRARKAGKPKPAKSKSCTLTQKVGSFTHKDAIGRNRIAFTGRVNGRLLLAGSYTLTIQPKVGSVTGAKVTLRFTVS